MALRADGSNPGPHLHFKVPPLMTSAEPAARKVPVTGPKDLRWVSSGWGGGYIFKLFKPNVLWPEAAPREPRRKRGCDHMVSTNGCAQCRFGKRGLLRSVISRKDSVA